MSNENELTVADTPEATAAEDAAFAAAFNETRGESAAAGETLPAEPVADEPAAEAVGEGEAEVPAEETPATEAEPAKLFAGLTEEQLQTALARSGSLQTTVDKMAGRIGQLMQQIEGLRATPPTTQAAQQALDLKLEKLSAAFPELASMLREDLAGLQGGVAGQPALAPAAPAGITQEQLDAALAERLNQAQASMQEKMEVKVLSVLHPDWLTVIKSPQFALWRDNVLGPVTGKQLMESEDSAFISQYLTQFKNWREQSSAAPAPAPRAPVPPSRTSRLANAVIPNGGAGRPVTAPVTEEDAFAAAFAKERARGGR
jgi:hypothetical protein